MIKVIKVINLNDKLKALHLDKQLTLDDLPQVDLYMDQVIQLFENAYGETLRNEDEKVLTKTMINNYSKGKLLFPIQNKKYSNDHLILMSLIYQLKGGLSISDIKISLDEINKKVVEEDQFPLTAIYETYLSLAQQNVKSFESSLSQSLLSVQQEVSLLEGVNLDSMENFLLIASLIHMSSMYRRVAEVLVDDMKMK